MDNISTIGAAVVVGIVSTLIYDALKVIFRRLKERSSSTLRNQRRVKAKNIIIMSRNPDNMKMEAALDVVDLLRPIFVSIFVVGFDTCLYLDDVVSPASENHATHFLINLLFSYVNFMLLLEVIVFFIAVGRYRDRQRAYIRLLGRLVKGQRVNRYQF